MEEVTPFPNRKGEGGIIVWRRRVENSRYPYWSIFLFCDSTEGLLFHSNWFENHPLLPKMIIPPLLPYGFSLFNPFCVNFLFFCIYLTLFTFILTLFVLFSSHFTPSSRSQFFFLQSDIGRGQARGGGVLSNITLDATVNWNSSNIWDCDIMLSVKVCCTGSHADDPDGGGGAAN
jgi:hypothetical protein